MSTKQMDSRALAALLSATLSHLLLLLLLLFPSSTHPISHNALTTTTTSLFPLILQFLTSSQLATSLSLLSSKKRKRTTQHENEDEEEIQEEEIEEENHGSVLSSQLLSQPHLDSYKVFFRMNSETFHWLSGLLEPLLECRDPINSPLNLSPEIRLGIGLFRLATGADYADIARRFGVSKATSRFCTKQLCRVLCTNFRFWVAFPTPIELQSVSTAFEALTRFPNCCGVIDCTRFEIKSRENSQEESIVAQIVVDSSSRILSIVAGFRGDKGDSRVLKSSTLYQDIQGGELLNSPPVYLKGEGIPQYLIGDGGYPLLPWLMVPFVDPVSASCEEDFNIIHDSMRLPALRTIASLRNWGILNQPIEEELKTAVACIGACSILHNILLTREDYSAFSDETEDFSVHDQNSQYYADTSSEENLIEKMASPIRNALAARARDIHDSNRSVSQ